jgi:hypothetical protein
VLDGANVKAVVNAGKAPLYRLARAGQGSGHALVENAAMTSEIERRADLVAFAAEAQKVADRVMVMKVGPVRNAAHIKTATGFDLDGYERIIDNYGIRHTLKQHGSDAIEATRGQIAVTTHDFGLIDLITSWPDSVAHGGKNKIGRDVLIFTKLIDGIGYRHVEELRSSRRLVATDSLRKKKGAWGS